LWRKNGAAAPFPGVFHNSTGSTASFKFRSFPFRSFTLDFGFSLFCFRFAYVLLSFCFVLPGCGLFALPGTGNKAQERKKHTGCG